MSALRCSKCKGLLPAWLTAAGGATSAKCPNCAHVNELAGRTAPPQPAAKGTDAYSTLEGQANKSPSLNKTMFMGSGTAKPQDQNGAKAVGLAKTMMMAKAETPAPVAAAPQKRTPTLPGSAPVNPPEFPATTPLPVLAPSPAEVKAAAVASPAPAAPAKAAAAIDSGETDVDVDVEMESDTDTPPPAPPSKTSIPSWVVSEPLGDGQSEAVITHDRMAFLRSRTTLLGAGAVGVVGLVLAVVLLSRGGKPRGPVSVEVKRPPVEKFTPPAPEPEPAPQPEVAHKAPEPAAKPAARKAPEPVVARKAPEPAPAPPSKPAERPRPVAAAPAPAPAPAAAPRLAVASAQHVAAASPERARRGPSEDDQRLAREAYSRGNTQLFQGHADEAINTFKESLKLDPHNAASMRGLGLAYGQTGNAAQAVQFLKRYLKASPAATDRALVEKRIEQLSAH